MDYLHFLRQRIHFTRWFYDQAAFPFTEQKRKIEAGEEPFDHSYGFEEDEPAFLEEWSDADEALDVAGQFCISMASSSLHLYLDEWIFELVRRAGAKQLAALRVGLPSDPKYKRYFKKGWINGYRAYCAALGVDWTNGPSNLKLLEEIVLARNTVQHSSDITSVRAKQSREDAKKHLNRFFADPLELALFDRSKRRNFLLPVRLNITSDKLFAALDEIERFCEWLDGQHPIRRPRSSP